MQSRVSRVTSRCRHEVCGFETTPVQCCSDRVVSKSTPLNAPDASTFYTPGPKGYTDYPVQAKEPELA